MRGPESQNNRLPSFQRKLESSISNPNLWIRIALRLYGTTNLRWFTIPSAAPLHRAGSRKCGPHRPSSADYVLCSLLGRVAQAAPDEAMRQRKQAAGSIAFSLDTFSWLRKRKYFASRARPTYYLPLLSSLLLSNENQRNNSDYCFRNTFHCVLLVFSVDNSLSGYGLRGLRG